MALRLERRAAFGVQAAFGVLTFGALPGAAFGCESVHSFFPCLSRSLSVLHELLTLAATLTLFGVRGSSFTG